MKANRITSYALLTALALILSYVESQIPAFFAVPGMKLGLTNLVVMIALYRLGSRDALTVNVIRICLGALLFGNGFSLVYSLSGGVLSTLVMIALKRTDRFGMLGVSIAGGLAHNIGQILAAMVLLGTWRVASYLLALWVSGIAAGLVIGLLSYEITRRLPQSVISGGKG
jgi:heptaprenyl diphosphate synthase